MLVTTPFTNGSLNGFAEEPDSPPMVTSLMSVVELPLVPEPVVLPLPLELDPLVLEPLLVVLEPVVPEFPVSVPVVPDPLEPESLPLRLVSGPLPVEPLPLRLVRGALLVESLPLVSDWVCV
jgi:hypothetical protein